jgi:tetrapyrrole methylase family protein/MazG family protein/ATP diphosphatase
MKDTAALYNRTTDTSTQQQKMSDTDIANENSPLAHKASGDEFCRLIEIIRRLRAPDGCPWDREQTPKSIMKYLLEETYELLEAIEEDMPKDVAEELGDLLFMLVFLARMYEEQGRFTLQEVLKSAAQKMIRRHPHIFGDIKINDTADVIANWQRIKEQEAKDKGVKHSSLGNLPKTLPALQLAFRVGERASRTGFDWHDAQGVIEKLQEEEQELIQAIRQGDSLAIQEEMGDLLFTAANLARHLSLNPEEVLKQTVHNFILRFQRMETLFKDHGKKMTEATIKEMDEAWKITK